MKAAIYCRFGNKEQIIKEKMDEKVKEQILAVRKTGLTNMFDIHMVQKVAFDMEFYDLVLFLEDHVKEYTHFIMNGETQDAD